MRPGTPWGVDASGDPELPVVDVAGDDAALAAAALTHRDAVLRFAPTEASDLARALGLGAGTAPGATVVDCDLLDLGHGRAAVNAVVLGVAPDRLRSWHRLRPVTVEVDGRSVGSERATSVVIANGQFLRGADLVPRGHPGDGRIEVQVYALRPGERKAMRSRLARGDHVPHPRIVQGGGRSVVVRWEHGAQPVEADGHSLAATADLKVDVLRGGLRVRI